MNGVFAVTFFLTLSALAGSVRVDTSSKLTEVFERKGRVCGHHLVEEACLSMSMQSPRRKDRVSVAELSTRLSTKRDSVLNFLQTIHIKDEDFKCSTLCAKTIEAAERMTKVPVASDMACREVRKAHVTEVVCDIDVSMESFSGLRFDADLVHDKVSKGTSSTRSGQFTKKSDVASHGNPGGGGGLDGLYVQGHAISRSAPEYQVVSEANVMLGIANVFHVYPFSLKRFVRNQRAGAEHEYYNSYMQIYAKDNLTDNMADDEDWEAKVQELSTRTVALIENAKRAVASADQREDVRKALDFRFNSKSSKRKIKGEQELGERNQIIMSVLNSMTRVLNNVDYIYPGRACHNANQVAYMDAKRQKSLDDEDFEINLCRYFFFEATEDQQIQTLAHESSHHKSAKTDDVEFTDKKGNPKVAYGDVRSRLLADIDPSLSLGNADNYGYFVYESRVL